ncbi:hypothetical protein LCGC14_3141620 [marine sediment metagenome]|uniref:Uncharacterized protein n=1 Tax=marine sediment metagenome TaxID=412755 RepID=A0A0F8VWL3_9ZZZZ
MSREAYRSLYGDLTKLKDNAALDDPAAGTSDDDELFQLLLSVSEAVEGYCNRHFYPLTATRLFDGPGSTRLLVPDLLSVTTLKGDDDHDKTFEVDWATTDYWTENYNAEPTKHWGHAYDSLMARAQGTKASGFIRGEQNYQIVGKWGHRDYQEDSGTTTDSAGYTATATTIQAIAAGGAKLAIGQTILIGTEQLLITNIATNALTVSRGINGTTAATIAASQTAVSILRWPLPVERATLIWTARLWTRAPAFEPFYVDADQDTDVRILLDPYRRLPV